MVTLTSARFQSLSQLGICQADFGDALCCAFSTSKKTAGPMIFSTSQGLMQHFLRVKGGGSTWHHAGQQAYLQEEAARQAQHGTAASSSQATPCSKHPSPRLRSPRLLVGPNGLALLPPHGAGFAADSNSDPVLDVGKDPNGDRRRPRGLRVPGPNRGRCPVSGASPGRGVGSDFQLGAGAVHAPHCAEPTS